MKNMLRYIPSKDGRKVKRTTAVSIGFIGLSLTAGILFTVLLLNSSVSAPSTAPDSSAVTTLDSQNLNANAAPDTQ